MSGDCYYPFTSVILSPSVSAFIDWSCDCFVFQNCFHQELKIRILNVTEPIDYLQVSQFVHYFPCKAMIKGFLFGHNFSVITTTWRIDFLSGITMDFLSREII